MSFLWCLPGAGFLLLLLYVSGNVGDGQQIFTLFDDAMISMTYGRTLAETGELVWYPGAERIQGFTNPLWTLFMAGLHLLGLSGSIASLTVSFAGILSMMIAALASSSVAASLDPASYSDRNRIRYAVVLAVPITFPLAFWTLRGMEVGVLAACAALLSSLIYSYGRNQTRGMLSRWLFLAVAAVGIATRLDFLVVASAYLLGQIAFNSAFRPVVLRCVAAIAALVVWVAFVLFIQYVYYGEALPNTYYLKIDGYSTVARSIRGLASLAPVLPLIAVGGYVVWINWQQRSSGFQASALHFLVLCAVSAYNVWVGGDAWEWSGYANRYLSVVMVIAVALVVGNIRLLLGSGTHVKVGLWAITLLYPLTAWQSYRSGSAVLTVAAAAFLPLMLEALCCRLAPHANVRLQAWVIAASLVLPLGAVPVARHIFTANKLLHVADDRRMADLGRRLNEVTLPSARIAVVWAGAPIYYSQRPAVDLLGKSDRYIAHMSPVGAMHPGHNKWDLLSSLQRHQPDLVFQLWKPTAVDFDVLRDLRYVARCMDGHQLFVRSDSQYVQWNEFVECSR